MRIFSVLGGLSGLLLLPALSDGAQAAGDRYFELFASPGSGSKFDDIRVKFLYVPGTARISLKGADFLGAEFGAQLGKHFAAGVEATYGTARMDTYSLNLLEPQDDGSTFHLVQSGKLLGKVQQGTLSLNGYYEYPIGAFVPFIGAGAGVAVTEVGQLKFDDVRMSQDGGYSFLYKLMAGIQWALTDTFALSARYTYADCDHPAFQTYKANIKEEYLQLDIVYRF